MRKSVGIDLEVRASSETLFPVSPENWKHVAVLTKVSVETNTNKDDEEYISLDFHFQSPNGDYNFTHKERAVESDDAKFDDKSKWCDQRMAHIYNAFMGVNAHTNVNGKGLGTPDDATDASWEGYFHALARDFNTARKGAEVFKDDKKKPLVVWLRLVYTKTGYLSLPFPNFIELYREDKPCLLMKGKDSYEQPKKDNPFGGGGNAGAGNGGGNPGTTVTGTKTPPPGF